MATINTLNTWTNIASTVWDFGNTKITYYLDAMITSQDTVNNKSYIKTKLRSVLHYGWANSQNYTFTCSYAPTVSGTNSWYSGTEDITVSTSSQEIAHNSDGTKTISLSARAYMSGVGDTTFSGDATLKAIPRASKLNSASMSIASNGNSITVTPNMSKSVSSYYDSLTIKNGNTNLITLDGVTHNTAKSLTSAQISSIYSAIGTATTKTFTCYLTTYTNSSKTTTVGTSSSVNLVATLPSYSLSFTTSTVEDSVTTYNTYKPNTSTFIANLSKPKYTFSASSNTGSTYGRSIGYAVGSTAITSPYINNNYTGQSLTITASDGRKSVTSTPSMTHIPYFTPTVNATVTRTTPTGSTIDVTVSGTYYDGDGLTNLNNTSITLKYTEAGGTEQTTTLSYTTTVSNHTVSYTATTQLTGMNYQKSVQWSIIISDKLGQTKTISNTVTQGLPVWNGYRKNDVNYFNVNGNLNTTGIITEKDYQLTPIDITDTSTSILNRVKDLASHQIYQATWFSRTDGGTANISDKPTGSTQAGFVCYATCNRWVSSTDWRYVLTCYVQLNGNYFYTAVTNSTTSITWQQTSLMFGRGVKTLSSKSDSGWGTNNNYIPDMAFIAYWNGAYSGTSSNLTYAHQGVIQCKPTSLYDNTTGTTGTVTLSQTSANFSVLEIYYRSNNTSPTTYDCVRVWSPNGKTASMIIRFRYDNNGYTQYDTKRVTISGTSITHVEGTYSNTQNGACYAGNQNTIYITKVLGYKY